MSLPREKTDLPKKLHDVPHQPGVYVMRDRLNRVIYVGKARDLRKRLSSYFMPSRAKQADIKTRALIDSIWDFDIHTVRNDAEALILEMRLIKDFRPKYNISFKDDKRYLLVKVQLADAIPRFTFTRLKKDDGARYFGPYAHSTALRTTLSWMNRHFGLRVCRPLIPGESDFKHCNNDIIKNCSAPCIGRISREEYRTRIDQACDFLSGKSRELITALEAEMQKLAERLDFERAAEMRDMIADFKTTLKPTRTFERGASIRVASTMDPMADVRELQEELRLPRPPLVMECFDIANIGTAHCVASMVRFKNGTPDNANYRRYRIKVVDGQNDFAAMSEVVRRRYSRILLEAREALGEDVADATQEAPLEAMQRMDIAKDTKFVSLPDLIIVDGGKGQLSVAMKELQRLGLQEVPIIGLAKENEEIFRPDQNDPLVLSHRTGALKLLQRIRDEAHRWANGYHQLLLQRRVQESILDDCPGVSTTRKAALLREFGSVARLRRAKIDEIAAVPGIGKALAGEVMKFLSGR